MKRRDLLKSITAAAMLPRAGVLLSADEEFLTKEIPSTGEHIPVIGMGTFKVFEIDGDLNRRDRHAEVVRTFFEHGGVMIDSSPMYTVAEDVIGYALNHIGNPEGLISSTKVWNTSTDRSRIQFEKSKQSWGLDKFDIFMVHNVDVWNDHQATVATYKQNGEIRYLGVSTSHGRQATELEHIMQSQPIDFVQLSYNILDRAAEDRLLRVAQDQGIAIMANRPFQGGELLKKLAGRPIPEWSTEIGCSNWAQVLLKYIVSHPAVTCTIPATSQVSHMIENMGALVGPLPDAAMRETMRKTVESLV